MEGRAVADRHKSHLSDGANLAQSLVVRERRLGQSDPRHCPHEESAGSLLGEPLAIEEVAEILGCSVWTVRQKYLPKGLPHLRASATGKFVFFREQVIDWILQQQQKGGVK